MTQIAVFDGEPYHLDDRYDVVERFRLDGETAVILDADEAIDEPGLVHVEPTYEVDLRTVDIELASAEDVATIEDVRRVDDVPRRGTTGRGVHVASTDTGIDPSHPVFDGVTVHQVDVTGTGTGDSVGHGTATSGQIVRLAPDVTLTMIKIFPDAEHTRTKYIMRAYQWLFEHAAEVDVVNMSWGAQSDKPTLDRQQNRLVSKGVRDTTAAGNTGGEGGSPATASKAFAAGACDKDRKMASFSSYTPGEDPEVVAVGVNDRLARASGTSMGHPQGPEWTVASGTSFAAPELAGMVARYLERNPSAAPAVVREDFDAHAVDIPDTPRDANGIADYERTIGGSGIR